MKSMNQIILTIAWKNTGRKVKEKHYGCEEGVDVDGVGLTAWSCCLDHIADINALLLNRFICDHPSQ